MPKAQPERKPEPSKPPALRVLPMQLQIGNHLSDERSEWQVIGRPYTTAGGKTVHVSRGVGEAAGSGRHSDLGRA